MSAISVFKISLTTQWELSVSHTRTVKLWLLTESMSCQRRLSLKCIAHYENRIVLSASIRLVNDLEVCDWNDVPDGLLEIFLRDGHVEWCSNGRKEDGRRVQ